MPLGQGSRTKTNLEILGHGFSQRHRKGECSQQLARFKIRDPLQNPSLMPLLNSPGYQLPILSWHEHF